MTDKKPFEVARETLKHLVARKFAPTPANYQLVYNEIAGTPNEQPFPDEPLRQLVQALPAKTPGQQKQRALLEQSIGQRNWQGVQNALVSYASYGASAIAEHSPARLTETARDPALTVEFLGQIARLIENAMPALGADDPRFQEQAETLLLALRDPSAEITAVKTMLINFSHRLSFAAEDQAEIRQMLLKLLNLIIKNIGELSLDDSWLKGQVDALKSAAEPPLTLRRLDDVERRLKDVIFKQTEAKGRALEAQEEMRKMLSVFIERLSSITETSGAYHGKMEERARLMEQATTFEEMAPVLKEVISDTRVMATDSRNTRDELRTMREKTLQTEADIAKLHQELDRVSALARHDPLTGALNRQGLDESINREVATMRRKETPLSVSLLDIDNFKKLNDTKGHAVGDEALTHLATVARESMRPQDTLARYGGEEFVILMPDTSLEQGIEAMTRLQRELSRRFFMTGSEKVLITFSAGVAQLAPDEAAESAIRRADQAMYHAKRAGKNRVVGT